MKNLLLYILTFFFAMSAFAELPDDGYYRVQNASTQRYAYLLDNKGSVNVNTTSADVAALKLYSDASKTISDPATVFYLEHPTTSKNKYNIIGQGTNLYSFFNEYVNIIDGRNYNGKPCVMVYGSNSGMVRYLGDKWSDLTDPEGMASVDCTGDDRKWYVHPLDADTDSYFGVAPSVAADGKYYQPLYASFPFSAYSSGVKFYAITEIDPRGAVIYKEITGTVPGGTPVIVECQSPNVSDNRLIVGGSANPTAAPDNLLKGVYFDNPSQLHYNRTPFNKQTMRVLGVKDGKPAFVEGNYDFIPRNQAYLQLTDPASYSVKDFPLMTAAERDEAFKNLGFVDGVAVDSLIDVYTLDGRLVKSGVTYPETESLPKGVYVLKSGSRSSKLIH